jgi:hypothetical protein
MPRIYRSLHEFVGQWNNRPLRTERGRSPRQLFEFPLAFDEQLAERSFADTDWTLYGIDDDAPGSDVEENGEGITVPESTIVPTEEEFRQLQTDVDPVFDDQEHGRNSYSRAVRLVSTFSM